MIDFCDAWFRSAKCFWRRFKCKKCVYEGQQSKHNISYEPSSKVR